MSKQVTYSSARATLAELLERATANREAITITRRNGDDVVLIAASEYESLRETAYLLRSPANAQRLREAIEEAEAGKGKRMNSEEFDAYIRSLDGTEKGTRSRKAASGA
jgi:antitoxin YefM